MMDMADDLQGNDLQSKTPISDDASYLIDRTRVPRQEVQLLRRRFIPDVHRLIRRPR